MNGVGDRFGPGVGGFDEALGGRVTGEDVEWCQHNAALTRPFLWRVGCERARGVMQDVSRGHRLAKREVASMALLELPCPGRLDTEHRQNVTFCQRLGGFDEASWCASRRRMRGHANATQL